MKDGKKEEVEKEYDGRNGKERNSGEEGSREKIGRIGGGRKGETPGNMMKNLPKRKVGRKGKKVKVKGGGRRGL